MDEVGAEVSQKIRSAIKAKLMELGAYVDEELPDYIMVMVANRRSREQMEDDLQLFLGSNTEEFTGWLHQVLQKLQEVTVASLERKRKASTGDSEGENIKKEKRRKSSERKKIRRGSEQTRGKDAKDDSENANQHSGKHTELEKLTKSHLDQSVSGDDVNSKITDEYIGKTEVRIGGEQSDKIISLSHNLDTTKTADTQVSSGPELSQIVRKDSGKLLGDQGNFKSSQKSDETYSGKSGCRKIILGGKTNASGKILCSSMEESCNVHKSLILNPIKKGTGSGSETDITLHEDVRSSEEMTAAAAVHLQPVSRPKIILMQSDDDDDEDFINIKADAEAEELLDAELPKETPQETNHGSVKVNTAALCSKNDGVLTSSAKDEQNVSSAQWFPLSDRFGAKVTSGSVLDRLGVKKVTHESNSPLLRFTDRLSDKINDPVSDRLGGKKMRCDDTTDSDQSANRSIPVMSQPEQHSVSVAQVTPTAVKTLSRMVNVDTETEQFEPKTIQRPLNEEETAGKDQMPRKRLLLSRVVAMHREAEEEEEYDPANPAVGSVASVVRVKPRPKVPAALQANKNLILKAMAEAQKSVANAPKRVEPHERLDGFYTRKFRDNKGSNKIAITLPNRRMQPHKLSPVTEKPSDVERIVIPVKLEASRSISSVNLQQKIVIQVSSDKPAAQDTVSSSNVMNFNVPEENATENISSDYEKGSKKLMEVAAIVGTEREETNEGQRAVAYESESPWSKDETELVSLREVSRTGSPQFVVTLDGLDPSVFEVHSRKKQQSYSVTVNSPNMDSESSTVEYQERKVNRSEEVQRQKRAASPILYQKSEGSDAAGSVTDTLKQKINERCKYWPACRSGDKCIYLHPTVPCKSFPNCKFGDKCLYIHPNCKFDASCTRRDCPFTHASPRNMSSATSAVTRATASAGRATQQVCRFFPKCSNMNCRFLHPKPCRFGRYCSRKAECTFLHEDIPPADKLKWFCPFRL